MAAQKVDTHIKENRNMTRKFLRAAALLLLGCAAIASNLYAAANLDIATAEGRLRGIAETGSANSSEFHTPRRRWEACAGVRPSRIGDGAPCSRQPIRKLRARKRPVTRYVFQPLRIAYSLTSIFPIRPQLACQ